MHSPTFESETPWHALTQVAARAGVSIEYLCLAVESATQFARDSVNACKAEANLPYPTYDDLEAVVQALRDDDFEWEIKQTPWVESDHPRDERGRFTNGGEGGYSAQSILGDAGIRHNEIVHPFVPASEYQSPLREMHAEEARQKLIQEGDRLSKERERWAAQNRVSERQLKGARDRLVELENQDITGLDEAQLDALIGQMERVGAAIEHHRQLEVRERQDVAKLRELLYVVDPTTISFHLAAHPDFAKEAVPISSEHDKEAALTGTEEVRRLVSDQLITGEIYFEQETNPGVRSNHAGNGRIRIADEAGTRVVVHEFGHILEARNPEISRKAREFLRRRTQDEKTLKLSSRDPSYGEDEEYRKDKFISPYMGKIYRNGTSTEIFSMGLEHFHSDPLALAKGDPEYFNLIYSSLHPPVGGK